MLVVVLAEFTRRCLAIVVAKPLRSVEVLQCLADLLRDPRTARAHSLRQRPGAVAMRVRELTCL